MKAAWQTSLKHGRERCAFVVSGWVQ